MNHSPDHSQLIARWARAGAGFNVTPSDRSPDLERLLLETARAASADARLFNVALTWLSRYDGLIAKNRLAALILAELEERYRPVLGLLLDMTTQLTHSDRFNVVLGICGPAAEPQPLFEVERRNPALWSLAKRRASEISIKWNLWAPDMELKLSAIRPAAWIMKHNPGYRERGAFKGDLRASVVEELKRNPEAGESESMLARLIYAQRAAVRDAISDLEMIDRVERVRERNRSRIRLRAGVWPGSVPAT